MLSRSRVPHFSRVLGREKWDRRRTDAASALPVLCYTCTFPRKGESHGRKEAANPRQSHPLRSPLSFLHRADHHAGRDLHLHSFLRAFLVCRLLLEKKNALGVRHLESL